MGRGRRRRQGGGEGTHGEVPVDVDLRGGSKGDDRCKGNDDGHLYCPLMSTAEVAELTVHFDQLQQDLLPVLERHGAAIVTGIATDEECAHFERLFNEDLAELQGAASGDSKSWTDARSWPLESMPLLGIKERCQLRGLPHGRFAWRARLHPRVRRVYEVIHGTSALVSSCDNSFFAPPTHGEETRNKDWPHVDQNMHDARFADDEGILVGRWSVFQGLFYAWGSDSPHASTTVLWCGSHTDVYSEVMADTQMQARGRKGYHFTQLRSLQRDAANMLLRGWRAAARRVPVPAGSLLLWDSKTVHQGWSGGPRLAQPVCWEPAGRRSGIARERKLRLAALGLPSTHSASLGQPHMLVRPQLSLPAHAARDQPAMASTLRPVTLAAGVDVMTMWRQLAGADWNAALPAESRDLVERSIGDQYAEIL